MRPPYKRMLDGMMRTQKGYHREVWFIYILKCQDETFYTGVTKDLERRLKMHNSGKASRYTCTRRPVAMIYSEKARGRANALVRECAIKAMSREAKERLVNGKAASPKLNNFGGRASFVSSIKEMKKNEREMKCRPYSRRSSKARSLVTKSPRMKII